MNIKILLRTAVAAALLTVTAGLRPAPAAAQAPERPNIVVIMADDQDDMGSMAEMPQLQQLAANGVNFSNSFVDVSLCCPSRASFLTGQAAHNSKIIGNKPPNGGWAMFKATENNTLGAWLQAAGYRTALLGKLMNGYGQEGEALRTHVMPGWSEWDVISDPHGSYRYFRYTLNENGKLKTYGKQPYDYQTDVIAQKGEAFIRASDGPFFLLMQPIAPHGTHGDDVEDGEKGFPDPAPRYANTLGKLKLHKSVNFNEEDVSDKPGMIRDLLFADAGELQEGFRRRREAMLAVDDMIKRVVSVLTETGKLDNTYIVVTSDNGYSEGSHRYQGKIVLYEESIRVPLVISGPGVPKGEVRDQMVNNLDLVASIIDWSGATPGRTMDGRSLTPVLVAAAATKDRLYTELESGQWGSERELYNLTADPGQMRNVINAPRYSDEISQLHTILAGLQSCAGASCWLGDAIPSASRGR